MPRHRMRGFTPNVKVHSTKSKKRGRPRTVCLKISANDDPSLPTARHRPELQQFVSDAACPNTIQPNETERRHYSSRKQ